ncbi:hypothetical protein MKX01_033517, partial [Papaver californicum]
GKGKDERVIPKRNKKSRSYYPKLADGKNQRKDFSMEKMRRKVRNEILDSSAEKMQDGVESLDNELEHPQITRKKILSLVDGALKKSMLLGNGEVVTELKLGKGECLKIGTWMKSENGKRRSE